MILEKINHSYLTAVKRTDLSAPVQFLLQHKLLKGRILDFGCGLGYDADELKRRGFDVTGYDNYYRTEYPKGKFDTIFCVFVLDVLEPYAQIEVMMNVFNLLSSKGSAYFAVQRGPIEEGFKLHPLYREYVYQCDVRLSFLSLESNFNYELYQYHHRNELSRKDVEICPFCHLSQTVEVICETDTCVAFYDEHPISCGHALIIPKRHVASYFDLTNREQETMYIMLQYVKQKVEERYHPDGYHIEINVNEAAGQRVRHVHVDLIPCFKKDMENPKDDVQRSFRDEQKSFIKQQSPKKGKSAAKKKGKAYTIDEKRNEHGNAYIPWEEEADKLLCRMFDEGNSIALLAEIFERSKGAIKSRLKKLGKIEDV